MLNIAVTLPVISSCFIVIQRSTVISVVMRRGNMFQPSGHTIKIVYEKADAALYNHH